MNIIEQARKIRADMNAVTATLTDEQGLELIALFEPWRTDLAYAVGDRRRHGDKLYRCVQAHTSQDGWLPDVVPALWTLISIDEWPEWVRPTGAHNAYQTGDKVTYNGMRYICEVTPNTWAPGVYGWRQA